MTPLHRRHPPYEVGGVNDSGAQYLDGSSAGSPMKSAITTSSADGRSDRIMHRIRICRSTDGTPLGAVVFLTTSALRALGIEPDSVDKFSLHVIDGVLKVEAGTETIDPQADAGGSHK